MAYNLVRPEKDDSAFRSKYVWSMFHPQHGKYAQFHSQFLVTEPTTVSAQNVAKSFLDTLKRHYCTSKMYVNIWDPRQTESSYFAPDYHKIFIPFICHIWRVKYFPYRVNPNQCPIRVSSCGNISISYIESFPFYSRNFVTFCEIDERFR